MFNKKYRSFGILFGLMVFSAFTVPISNISHEISNLSYSEPISQQGSLDNNIEWDYIYHNSREAYYRSPGWGTTEGNQQTGAVLIGTDVTIRIRTLTGDVEEVKLRIWDGPNQQEIIRSMEIESFDSEFDYWKATIISPSEASDYYYRFDIKDGTDSDYYQDDNNDGGLGKMYNGINDDQTWGIVFYNSSFETPDWHQNAVGYQIFPERFYNGDTSNDPIGDGVSGDIMWYPWDMNGNDHQDENEVAIYANKREWNEDNPGTWDFYGGDLKGVEDKVEYLDDLGIDFIWFNPFSEGPDNHGYSVDNYTSIDSYFGKIDKREDGVVYNDFDASLAVYESMTATLASHGIRPLYDAVVNHVFAQSVYMQRFETQFGVPDIYPDFVGAYENPPTQYREWFKFYTFNHDYDSWWGFDNIPTLMYEQSEGDIEEKLINGENSLFTFWQDHGIGGFRLDVPNMYVDGENSFHINKEIRNVVKENDPDDIVIGEIWGRANAWLTGEMHDGVQNMDLRDDIVSWLKKLETNQEFSGKLMYDQENYPSEAFYSQWTLLGNHDTKRILTDLHDDKDLLKMAVALQFTYPGVPVVYYGDEVGLNGASDPGCRKPYPWGNEDTDLLAFYKDVISLRKDYPVLRQGGMNVLASNNDHVFALARDLAGEVNDTVITILNRDEYTLNAAINVSMLSTLQVGDVLKDLITGNTITVSSAKTLDLTLNSSSVTIFVSQNRIDTSDDNEKNKISGYNPIFLIITLVSLSGLISKFSVKRK